MAYEEFSYLSDNAAEFSLPAPADVALRREFVDLGDGRRMSTLVWGAGPAEFVLVHGGAQNAHTWDTVALALNRPLIAVDLPGHGHSDGPSADGMLSVDANAADVAIAVRALAPAATAVVGMSLGGLTSIALTSAAPELVRSLVLVDITPGVNREKSSAISNFVNGPSSFPRFDDILARTVEHNPTRTVSSLRRGILHNAVQLDDGSWVWRYRRHAAGSLVDGRPLAPDYGGLWEAISNMQIPIMLVRGMLAQSVVDDADEAELLRRAPNARIEHVANAGHSVQGDTPVELARLIENFAPTPRR